MSDLSHLTKTDSRTGVKLMDVSLEQLTTAINVWNYTQAGKKTPEGGVSFGVHEILAGSALFGQPDTPWVNITRGPMAGSRYVRTQHGLVVQQPKPSNEMSLVGEQMAKVLQFDGF
jgi:hypothetical protein